MKPQDRLIWERIRESECQANEYRGITVVKTILNEIYQDRYENATRIAIYDNDKIRNYPHIQRDLRRILPEYDAHLYNLEKVFGGKPEVEGHLQACQRLVTQLPGMVRHLEMDIHHEKSADRVKRTISVIRRNLSKIEGRYPKHKKGELTRKEKDLRKNS